MIMYFSGPVCTIFCLVQKIDERNFGICKTEALNRIQSILTPAYCLKSRTNALETDKIGN